MFFIGLFVALSAFFVVLLDYQSSYVLISTLFMVVLAIPCYCYFVKATKRKGLVVLLLLSFFSMFIETLGVVTGFPYGFFNYTDKLGFFVGVIPWTVSFGWVPLVIASWFLTEDFFNNKSWINKNNRDWFLLLKKVVVGGFVLMVFDLVLDPGSISINFWEWGINGFYYGIPFSNFLGWIFSGAIGVLIIYLFVKDKFGMSSNVLFSAFFGNLFWTVIVIMQGFVVPSIIGVSLLFYLGHKLMKK